MLLNQRLAPAQCYRAAFFLPQVTATVAIAMVWLWIYDPQNGLLNELLSVFGICPARPGWPIRTPALRSVILVGIWQGIGMKMLIYLAALQNMRRELYEAASGGRRVPGCGSSSRSRCRC